MIPTSSSNYYSEYDHPSYLDVIKYCEFKFENYKKSAEWIENHNKKFLEERKQEEDERKRLEVLEAIELRKAKIERHKQDLEDQKRNDYAKQLGYSSGISEGIITTIRKRDCCIPNYILLYLPFFV